MAIFVVEVQSLAEYCNFGASLEAMFRDQVVCGINNTAIQRRLFTEVPLLLDKALKLVQEMETTAQNIKELQGGTALTLSKDIHKVTPQLKGKHARSALQSKEKSDHTCFRCGRAGHLASCVSSRMPSGSTAGRLVMCRLCAMGKRRGQPRKQGHPDLYNRCTSRWSPRSTHCFAWGQRTKAHYTT